ncbi:MAG TPA: ARMT1-like domain-containing protein [Desulfurivibrionaceae bacterium]|nr:ARMT1-like domain-containing protein [Desulfurivibrionaceae bacterium]
MRTAPACLPCFLRQARHVAAITGAAPRQEAEIIRAVERLVKTFDLAISPPENAVALYGLIAKLTSIPDPFAALKMASNRAALALLPRLREIVAASADPLATAARLAVAGNIIDYGASQNFDVEGAIAACLERAPAVDHFAWFQEKLTGAERILYLADNCGELVFDRLFIEQLGKPVTLAVKASPIINDALTVDTEDCGLTTLCRVIDNGTGCPGTPLTTCCPEFQKLFREADLIISKGQGNFETLSETPAPLFFLLLVKCQVVASHAAERAALPSEAIKVGDLLMLAPEALKA